MDGELTAAQRKSLDFLQCELRDGAKEIVGLERRAKAHGISIRSLACSRRILKVQIFCEAQTGTTLWRLEK